MCNRTPASGSSGSGRGASSLSTGSCYGSGALPPGSRPMLPVVPQAEWDPRGDVLFVGRTLPRQTVAQFRSRLADCTLHVLDLDDLAVQPAEPRPAADAPGGAEAATGTEAPVGQEAPAGQSSAVTAGFPPESDAAVETIEQLLAEHPRITSLLAGSRWAARDIWRVVRDRPGYLAFTHIDNLERARRTGVHPDTGPVGRRRFSHLFAFEFGGEEPVTWRADARVRLLIGPGNHHGRASGWARAARRIRGVDAIALSVGPYGFAADLMATPVDWDTPAVRDRLLAFVATATHVLIDDAPADQVAALAEAARGRVSLAGGGRLPVAVPPAPRPALQPDRRPHAVVIGRGRPDLPASWRVTRLAPVPRSLWVLRALTADVLIDTRTPAWLDVPVVAAMAQGAVLVSELPSRRGPLRRRVPHLTSAAEAAFSDPAAMLRLSEESIGYARSRHSDRAVARQLRRMLRVI